MASSVLRRCIVMLAVSAISFAATTVTVQGQESIGINYGRVANNLPPPDQVVRLLQSRSVKHVRIYDADPTVLRAFANTGIDVGVTIPNAEVAGIANSFQTADQWVQGNIVPYSSGTKFATIAVGNEYLVDSSLDHSKLLPAMQNIQQSLQNRGLSNSIKVSTPHSMGNLIAAPGFPPSSGRFTSSLTSILSPMLAFLSQNNAPFMINIYPFFSYRENPIDISLAYALATPSAAPVTDSGSNLKYTRLFDAMVDTVISAMATLGYGGVAVTVTESGWASGPPGEFAATVSNAQTYNGNLVRHVLGSEGTPLRPGKIPTFLFALFNENLKWGSPVENNFGLFYPNQTAVYDVKLTRSRSGLSDKYIDEGIEDGRACT